MYYWPSLGTRKCHCTVTTHSKLTTEGSHHNQVLFNIFLLTHALSTLTTVVRCTEFFRGTEQSQHLKEEKSQEMLYPCRLLFMWKTILNRLFLAGIKCTWSATKIFNSKPKPPICSLSRLCFDRLLTLRSLSLSLLAVSMAARLSILSSVCIILSFLSRLFLSSSRNASYLSLKLFNLSSSL